MPALPERASLLRSRRTSLLAGAALAAAAASAAPSTELLPGPDGLGRTILSAVVLLGAFAVGRTAPLRSLYGLVALAVLEGAIRKWIVNGITVFLLKDFLALGIYAAVLPRLTRAEWRRPWWLVVPLAGILALAVLSAPRSDSLSQAVIGLRSYLLYLPLLWVAPALLSSRRRVYALLGLVLGIGAAECVLAVAQALSGSGVLNKLVSGALPGVITLQGKAYLRPSGTFMQVGVLGAFLLFVALAAFALVLAHRRGLWLWLALGTLVLLTWGVVYTSARSLLGSIVLALVGLTAVLLRRRRFAGVAGVAGAFVLGYVLLFTVVPAVRGGVEDVVGWWQQRGYVALSVTETNGQETTVKVPPHQKEAYARAIEVPFEKLTIPGVDAAGKDVAVVVEPGTVGSSPTVTVIPRIATVTGIDENGKVVEVPVGSGEGEGKAGGFLGRAADFNTAGGKVGLWGSRVKPQLELIRAQRLIGHGPGTMTLGSEYADPSARLQSEGMYSKLVWELGLPGLGLFVWLLGAFVALAARGVARVSGWQRALAVVGLGATVLMPLWYVLTFALDFPIVGILFGLFGGCAVAYGSGAAPRRA